MSIDQLMASIGNTSDLGDLERSALLAAADDFLRAGGVITWDLWASLGKDSRAAFRAANERIQAEYAVAAGLAGLGPDSAAEILAPADGGDMKIRLALQRAAAEGRKDLEMK